jgi:hypothetical protein
MRRGRIAHHTTPQRNHAAHFSNRGCHRLLLPLAFTGRELRHCGASRCSRLLGLGCDTPSSCLLVHLRSLPCKMCCNTWYSTTCCC